jgi:AraC family transcriptional activator of pobA
MYMWQLRVAAIAANTRASRHTLRPPPGRRTFPLIYSTAVFFFSANGLCFGMASTLPLFHLYGDPPDDQAFDFIHVETIASRSSIHDWTIRAHRHRNLFQILLIERGGGEMTFDVARLPFAGAAAILVPATIAHGFRFEPNVTDGWVLSFTEDAAGALTDRAGEALARLRALAAQPVIPIGDEVERARLSALCAELFEEHSLAREGFRLAMRGLLVLIAVGVARLAASRARTGSVTLRPADASVAQLRALVDENFRVERQLDFYAEKLGMTVDRLNDHVKRSTGVTAGHLIRQRVLTEAKRQLVFTTQPIHDIAEELAFADPSHFARFFRKQTGTTPHEFRAQRGG